MRGWFHPIYVLLVFPFGLFCLFGNQFLYLSGAEFSDLTISHLPNALFLRRALLEWGQIPLWSSGILSGFPFAANPLSGLFYLPGWPAVIWPEAWMFNFLAGLHLMWGGFGMVLFLRNEGVGRVASVFGGLTFSLMPKLIAHYGAGHISLVYAVAWTPWLLFLTQNMDPSGSSFEFRISNFKSRLSYWPAMILAIIFYADVRWAAFAGVLWVGWSLSKTRKIAYSQMFVAALLVTPLALPLLEFIRLSTRASLSIADILAFSLPPARLIGLLFPEFGGMQEWVVYPGLMALILALIGWGWREVRHRTRFWWGVWLVSVLFSLGEYLPGLRVLAYLPGVSLLRVPSRAMFLAGVAIAVLAAYGLDHLLAGVNSMDRRRAGRILVAFTGAVLAISSGIWFLTKNLPFNFVWGAGMGLMIACGVGFALGGRNPTWAGLLLIGIGLLDWGVVGVRSLSPRPTEEVYSEKAEVAEFLTSQAGQFRVYSPSYSLPQHIAARNGIELADGVDPMQAATYVSFMTQASGVPWEGYSVTVPPLVGEVSTANASYPPDPKLLAILNVRYIVAEFDLNGNGLVLLQKYGETRIYENDLALSRAWIQSSIDVTNLPEFEPVDVNWSPNRIEMMSKGPGLLVLSEIGYPGWQVYVDGQRASLIVMNHLLRGVELPSGDHQVVFEFRPMSLFVGLGLFGVAMLFILASAKYKGNQE